MCSHVSHIHESLINFRPFAEFSQEYRICSKACAFWKQKPCPESHCTGFAGWIIAEGQSHKFWHPRTDGFRSIWKWEHSFMCKTSSDFFVMMLGLDTVYWRFKAERIPPLPLTSRYGSWNHAYAYKQACVGVFVFVRVCSWISKYVTYETNGLMHTRMHKNPLFTQYICIPSTCQQNGLVVHLLCEACSCLCAGAMVFSRVCAHSTLSHMQ